MKHVGYVQCGKYVGIRKCTGFRIFLIYGENTEYFINGCVQVRILCISVYDQNTIIRIQVIYGHFNKRNRYYTDIRVCTNKSVH